MVKKIATFFAYSIFFILALIYFTPKSSIYYLLEEQLKERDIIVSSEKLKERAFSLNVEHAKVSYKSIDSADISEITLNIFAIYNRVNFKDVILSSTAKSFVPLRVDSAQLSYTIFNPLVVNIYGIGEFGEADANYNIVENSLHLDLKPSKIMLQKYKSTLGSLVKTQNGEFTYDKTF